jgi:hypothetical protein
MRYLRLFEKVLRDYNLDIEDILKEETIYILYGKHHGIYEEITSGSFDNCISYYKSEKEDSDQAPVYVYDEIILIKVKEEKELLKEEDIEALISAKKYNL